MTANDGECRLPGVSLIRGARPCLPISPRAAPSVRRSGRSAQACSISRRRSNRRRGGWRNQLGGLPRPAHPSSWRRDGSGSGEDKRERHRRSSGPSTVAGSHPHMPALRWVIAPSPLSPPRLAAARRSINAKPDTRSKRADISQPCDTVVIAQIRCSVRLPPKHLRISTATSVIECHNRGRSA